MSDKGKLRIVDRGHLAYCPGCFSYHLIPGTWSFNGDYEHPSFNPSLLVRSSVEDREICCHSFIRDGKWNFLSDCSHALKNQVIPLRAERPKVVCLCGSTRFFREFLDANYRETLAGNIVLSVGFYPHAAAEAHGEEVGITAEQKELLDELHKRKIDLADEVLIINQNGYIGDSTLSEIEYAIRHEKPIRWFFPDQIPFEFVP